MWAKFMDDWRESRAEIPPMQPIIEQIVGQMQTEYENGVMKAVQSCDFNVDKERLTQALFDARSFYEEGYRAALREQEQRELESYLKVLESPWISVKERLPELRTDVLVYRKNLWSMGGYIAVDRMYVRQEDDEPMWSGDDVTWMSKVTHWMPLPEPPKED